jgi:hypothetical protein
MALPPEARLSGSAGADSTSIPAVLDGTAPRSTLRDDLSVRELLEEMQALVRQIVDMLNDPICEKHSRSASFRLARAHALTLLDHLKAMSESP